MCSLQHCEGGETCLTSSTSMCIIIKISTKHILSNNLLKYLQKRYSYFQHIQNNTKKLNEECNFCNTIPAINQGGKETKYHCISNKATKKSKPLRQSCQNQLLLAETLAYWETHTPKEYNSNSNQVDTPLPSPMLAILTFLFLD